jgi:hypothetical protein
VRILNTRLAMGFSMSTADAKAFSPGIVASTPAIVTPLCQADRKLLPRWPWRGLVVRRANRKAVRQARCHDRRQSASPGARHADRARADGHFIDHAARRRHTEQRMTMPPIQAIEAARLRAAARAQGPDARIWRWYSEQIDDQRLECRRHEDIWSVKVAGRELARDRSFDAAVRTAYAFSRALQAV